MINALMIGIPSFVLALEPNKSLVKGYSFERDIQGSARGADRPF
jgi:hypothetical protein